MVTLLKQTVKWSKDTEHTLCIIIELFNMGELIWPLNDYTDIALHRQIYIR